MKKNESILTRTVLYFVMYSISLAMAFFEFGANYPNTDGIWLVFLLPAFYLGALIAAIYLHSTGSDRKNQFVLAVAALAFILVLCCVSMILTFTKEQTIQFRIDKDTVYPLTLIVLSVWNLIPYLRKKR